MKIKDSKQIIWEKYQSSLIPLIPPHIVVDTPNKEIEELLKRSKSILARWVTNWDSNEETQFWAVIKDSFSGMGEYSSKMRNQIKKSQKHCLVKKVNKEFIIENGYQTYINAFKRYDDYLTPLSHEEFNNSINDLIGEWDFWAVLNNDKLIAYSQNYIAYNTAEYKIIKIDPSYMKMYPSYALIYEMNRYYLDELNYKYVNDGFRSIAHQTNIQDFLIKKFKFRKAFCNLNVIYSIKVRLAITILYPFRSLLKKINHKFAKKITALLYFETINKSFHNE